MGTLSLSQPKKGLRPQSTCHSSQLDSLTLNLTSCLASPSTSSTRLLPSRSACTRRSASCRAPTRTSWTSHRGLLVQAEELRGHTSVSEHAARSRKPDDDLFFFSFAGALLSSPTSLVCSAIRAPLLPPKK